MSRLAVALAIIVLAVPSCDRTLPGPLQVTVAPAGADTRVTLHAEPGLDINARVVPALELPNGTVVRFDGARTADSSSFAQPPTALLAGRHERIHGHLRASVCAKAEKVCRGVTLDL